MPVPSAAASAAPVTATPVQNHQRLWTGRRSDFTGALAVVACTGVSFTRGGYADPDVNRIAWFWSLGFQYQGALPSRDADIVGLVEIGTTNRTGIGDYERVVGYVDALLKVHPANYRIEG